MTLTKHRLQVGLTGGLASGKSFIGQELSRLGCFVVPMDELGHQVLEPQGAAYRDVAQEFRKEVDLWNPDGSIDRRALGTYVFSDPRRLARLNAIIHPAVRRQRDELVRAYFAANPEGIAVTEAAILVETGGYRDYDRLIVAVCRPEQQVERAMARDGLTRDEVLSRMSRQLPLEEKRKYAHFVIDTSGTEEWTLTQTRAVYKTLRSLPS
jgi:dephospho-CoA kinase